MVCIYAYIPVCNFTQSMMSNGLNMPVFNNLPKDMSNINDSVRGGV
jgi:hypothetical protein